MFILVQLQYLRKSARNGNTFELKTLSKSDNLGPSLLKTSSESLNSFYWGQGATKVLEGRFCLVVSFEVGGGSDLGLQVTDLLPVECYGERANH